MFLLNRNKTTLLLIFILLLGAALRLYNIGFELPFVMHPDESQYLPPALKMLARFDFNPKYFRNPPFLSYIYAFSVCLYYIIWKILSLFLHFPDFKTLWKNDRTSFYIIARCINAIFGTGTCLTLYCIGKKLFNKTIGIISCALLAFCFLHVRNSHYAVNDVPSLFFMVWAFKYIVDIYLDGKTKNYMLAGIMCGIAVMTKYNTGIIIVTVITAYLLQRHYQDVGGRQKLLIFFLSCLISACVACPWIIVDKKTFFYGFGSQIAMSKNHWFGASTENSYIQFLKTLLWGYGVIPCISLAIGSIMLKRNRKKFTLIMVFPIAYYFLLGLSRLFFVRFTIPIIPFLCIVSAYGIVHVFDCCPKYQKNMLVIFLTLIAISQGFIFSIRHDYLIGRTDTRIVARNWIRENIPSASKIITEGYFTSFGDYVMGESVKSYKVDAVGTTLPQKTLRDYFNKGYEFIITSDFIRMRYAGNKEKYPIESNFYSSLDNSAEKIYSSESCQKNVPFFLDDVYSPFWNLFILDKPGPCIKIYKIRDSKLNNN